MWSAVRREGVIEHKRGSGRKLALSPAETRNSSGFRFMHRYHVLRRVQKVLYQNYPDGNAAVLQLAGLSSMSRCTLPSAR